ncbi:alpha/beta hydrolase [Archangium violaceum]|uniref:lipase family alpha/beta hydrolase n=1 Tax=Archangium violaceum TaxID=83451 RepID=UPI002B2BB90F|nr:alpha/beta hydrolase [Archangium violaceum]
MKRFIGKAAALALVGVVLHGCDGNDSPPEEQNPPPPEPEETRAQDSRTYTVNETALPFSGLADAPESDRWWGVLNGSGYRIEVPRKWNGMLVMYAHGYAGTGTTLNVTTPSIRRHLLANGYAWAASSYSRNSYDVRAGVEDTNALALAFTRIAAEKGRTLEAPKKLYIIGHSMGGHIAAAAVDEENLQTANNKVRYDGAVPMCGVLGDTELFNYFAAYQTAAQQLAGFPATSWPVTNWDQLQPEVRAALFTTFPTEVTPQGEKLKQTVKFLTGGERPMFDLGFGGPIAKGIQDTVWGTFGSDGTVDGILNKDLITTRDLQFQLDSDAAVSAEEQTFNASIYRVQGDPEANRLRRDGLRWIPKANARMGVPVVSIHTLGDLFVPFSMEQIYKRRADANGTSQWLVQRAIRGISHCDFTTAEQVAAFDAMVKWEQEGIKPQGDEVLDPAVVASPTYGCAFTNNTVTTEEGPALGQLRASLAAAYPCPAP